MYRYELHLHTMETSRCGYVRAADQVRAYHRLGYQGLCVTDHLHNTYLSLMDCRDDWNACMDRFLHGYRSARKQAALLGMDVILGIELRFPENDSDYLVYGIDEAWLYGHPFICRMNHRSFFDCFKDEVLIIQAHPYRNCDVVYHDCIHGLEVINSNPRHNSRNELALALAEKNRSSTASPGPTPTDLATKGSLRCCASAASAIPARSKTSSLPANTVSGGRSVTIF